MRKIAAVIISVLGAAVVWLLVNQHDNRIAPGPISHIPVPGNPGGGGSQLIKANMKQAMSDAQQRRDDGTQRPSVNGHTR